MTKGFQLRGVREVELADGLTYKVFFSINAIINLQKKYGSLQKVFAEFEKGADMNFEVFLDFLHQGLQAHHGDIAKEELGNKIDFFSFEGLVQQLFGNVQDVLPPMEQNAGQLKEELPPEVLKAKEAAKKKD
jgi:hypothetical protein